MESIDQALSLGFVKCISFPAQILSKLVRSDMEHSTKKVFIKFVPIIFPITRFQVIHFLGKMLLTIFYEVVTSMFEIFFKNI